MNSIKAISRGVRAAMKKPKPRKFAIADRGVTCSQCGCETFSRHDLMKSFGSLFGERHAYGFECTDCHHLELFASQPDEIDDAE